MAALDLWDPRGVPQVKHWVFFFLGYGQGHDFGPYFSLFFLNVGLKLGSQVEPKKKNIFAQILA